MKFILLFLKRKSTFTKQKVGISTAQCHKARGQGHIKFVKDNGQNTVNNEQKHFYSSLC